MPKAKKRWGFCATIAPNSDQYFAGKTMNLCGAHLLSIAQFSSLSDLKQIFDVARELEVYARRERVTRVLEGAVMASLFFEPSTRTRISFESAFALLGGSVTSTTGFTFSSMAKGESIYDTSRVISGYADVMVVRHPEVGSVAAFADASTVPVINAGDGPGEHPTQALLDLYTIMKERNCSLEEVDGISIAMIGDLKHGRTVHSLTKLLSLFKKIKFSFVSPAELAMPQYILDMLRERGHEVSITESLAEGVTGADVIYMTRIQEERFASPEDYQRHRGSYTVSRDAFDLYCKPEAIILHPLPRDSRPGSNEIDVDLNDHSQLAIFRQTDNGIPVRMALFVLALGVADQIHKDSRPVNWFYRAR